MYTYMSNPAVFVDCEEGYAVVWVGWGYTCVSSMCLGEGRPGSSDEYGQRKRILNNNL